MTQLLPNPRVAAVRATGGAGKDLKGWQRFLGCALLIAVPMIGSGWAIAQQAPVPRPLPPAMMPLADGEAEGEAGPTDRVVETIPITANNAADAIAAATADPQPVTLRATIADGGRVISEGLVWRIFKADANGGIDLAKEVDSATAQIELPVGEYAVHVAYGRAQASDTITVAEGENEKSVVLEAGGLRLNAAVIGDVPIPINQLRFDVFTAGTSAADRELVAQGLGANDVVTVNAGTYHIVSYFGTVNAVVRADLRVEPGLMTDATIYHRAAQVSLKLVSEAGGEAIADVDWTVKAADGSTIFTETGAFPSTVLQEGDYVVLAKRGEQVYNRDFQIQPGQPREVEVLTTVY